MERYTRCGLLLFEVWSTDKQHQQYLGACKKKKKGKSESWAPSQTYSIRNYTLTRSPCQLHA